MLGEVISVHALLDLPVREDETATALRPISIARDRNLRRDWGRSQSGEVMRDRKRSKETGGIEVRLCEIMRDHARCVAPCLG